MKKKTLAAASLLLALLMPLGATPLAVYAEGDAQTEISAVSENPKGTGETNKGPEEKGETNKDPEEKGETNKDPAGKDETNDDPEGTSETNENPKGTSETNEDPEGTSETKPLKAGEIRVHTDAESKTYTADNADSFRTAMKEAPNGSTIELGAGTYSLYKFGADTPPEEKTAWEALMKGKTFTFVGQNPEKTFWRIGTPTTDQAGETNGDYSFDGAEQVTFKNMTLLASVTPGGEHVSRNYTGFIRPNHTVVEDCVIDGMTFYWGYVSASFKHTKFICGQSGYAYAVWTYSSPVETFDNCTFDASANSLRAPIIYVHNDGSDKLFTIKFKDCHVITSKTVWTGVSKQVLYIDDTAPQKFVINISGDNVIEGNVPVDKYTCSRLFGYANNAGKNHGHTRVTINNITVWENGQRPKNISHNGNNFKGTYNNGTGKGNANQYTEGYKDNNFKIINTTDWAPKADTTSTYVRTITKECQYCHEPIDEQEEKTGYCLRYDLNGGTGAEGTYNDTYYPPRDGNTTTVAADPSRAGYVFAGWQDTDSKWYAAGDTVTVDRDITLTAQWNKLVTVSFDLCGHGGANISSQTFVSGNKASEPTAPKENGWVFGGWYTEKGCKYRFSFDSAVTSDITLYAKWDRVTTVVSAPVATPTPSPAPAAAATKTATVKNAAIPQTSDAFPMEGLLALLAVGAVGFGAAGWLRKKHH